MSTVLQSHLPPELVHAVLMRMNDWDKNGQIKCGLASCSQTCRYWAASIRPLLFQSITLCSGEDVSQLVAFLNADSLQPALRGCIRHLRVVEDQASAKSPWSHQLLMRLHRRLTHADIVGWTVKGAPAASDGQDPQALNSRPLLPFSTIPRTLPPSLHRVTYLTLSGLSLRSLRDLARFVGNQITCEMLELDNVTFREETPDEIQLRRVPASRSLLEFITISHDLLDRDAILSWMKTPCILFASQGHERLDNSTLELVDNYLHLIVSHSDRQDQILHLQWSVQQPEEAGKHFHCLPE